MYVFIPFYSKITYTVEMFQAEKINFFPFLMKVILLFKSRVLHKQVLLLFFIFKRFRKNNKINYIKKYEKIASKLIRQATKTQDKNLFLNKYHSCQSTQFPLIWEKIFFSVSKSPIKICCKLTFRKTFKLWEEIQFLQHVFIFPLFRQIL